MDNRERWFDLIDGLGVFSSDGNKAVYKPLLTLMILARAQSKGENEFFFEEMETELRHLLKRFSSSRRLSCNYPFWYLRSDGYWEVLFGHGDPQTRKGKSSEPTSKGLRDAQAYGVVPEDLWRSLVQDTALPSDLARKLIDDYWPSSIREDVASATGIELAPKSMGDCKRDPAFREEVLRAYNFQCAICGFDGRISSELFGVEAAHIQARSLKLGNGPDTVQNGLSLCSLHHKAFDYGAISLDTDLRVLVSEKVSGSSVVSKLLREFACAELVAKPYQETMWPAGRFTRWHRKNLFREPAITR